MLSGTHAASLFREGFQSGLGGKKSEKCSMFPHMGRKVDIGMLQDKFQEELDVYLDSTEYTGPILTKEQIEGLINFGVNFMERENVRGMIFPMASQDGFIFRIDFSLLSASLATEKRPRMRGNFVDLTS